MVFRFGGGGAGFLQGNPRVFHQPNYQGTDFFETGVKFTQ